MQFSSEIEITTGQYADIDHSVARQVSAWKHRLGIALTKGQCTSDDATRLYKGWVLQYLYSPADWLKELIEISIKRIEVRKGVKPVC